MKKETAELLLEGCRRLERRKSKEPKNPESEATSSRGKDRSDLRK
jgi:hypothetical protein